MQEGLPDDTVPPLMQGIPRLMSPSEQVRDGEVPESTRRGATSADVQTRHSDCSIASGTPLPACDGNDLVCAGNTTTGVARAVTPDSYVGSLQSFLESDRLDESEPSDLTDLVKMLESMNVSSTSPVTLSSMLKKVGLAKPVNHLVWDPPAETTEFSKSKFLDRLNVVENVLHCLCEHDEKLLEAMLERLKQRHDPGTTTDVENTSLLRLVCKGIKQFVEYHTPPGGGSRSAEAQFAVEAVASAAMFSVGDSIEEHSMRSLSETLGMSRKLLAKTVEKNKIHRETRQPISTVPRKRRSDSTLPFLTEWVREKICHNNKYTRIDSFSKRTKVMTPVVEEMDGGGWTFNEYVEEEHPTRMWDDMNTLDDIYDVIMQSEDWAELLLIHPTMSMSRTTFAKTLCPCVKKPHPKSCVNVIKSKEKFFQKGFEKDKVQNKA